MENGYYKYYMKINIELNISVNPRKVFFKVNIGIMFYDRLKHYIKNIIEQLKTLFLDI